MRSNHGGRLVPISRALAKVLRHTGGSLMQGDGFAPLSDVLNLPELKDTGATLEDVEKIILGAGGNSKKRFDIGVMDDGVTQAIRAAQGHSHDSRVVRVDALPKVTELDSVLHGTTWNAAESIVINGIDRQQRIHIHFIEGEAVEGSGPISGLRQNAEVGVVVDAKKCMNDGIVFYRSSNGVILTDGENGRIRPDYITKVVDLFSNNTLFTHADKWSESSGSKARSSGKRHRDVEYTWNEDSRSVKRPNRHESRELFQSPRASNDWADQDDAWSKSGDREVAWGGKPAVDFQTIGDNTGMREVCDREADWGGKSAVNRTINESVGEDWGVLHADESWCGKSAVSRRGGEDWGNSTDSNAFWHESQRSDMERQERARAKSQGWPEGENLAQVGSVCDSSDWGVWQTNVEQADTVAKKRQHGQNSQGNTVPAPETAWPNATAEWEWKAWPAGENKKGEAEWSKSDEIAQYEVQQGAVDDVKMDGPVLCEEVQRTGLFEGSYTCDPGQEGKCVKSATAERQDFEQVDKHEGIDTRQQENEHTPNFDNRGDSDKY